MADFFRYAYYYVSQARNGNWVVRKLNKNEVIILGPLI